jgi:hypothetical protein
MDLTGQTVTVRRFATDRYGDRVLGVTFLVPRCAFAPRLSVEGNDRADTVTADAELYVPSWAGIEAADQVELPDGTLWEVQGRPENWWSPYTAWKPGDVVTLKRVTG